MKPIILLADPEPEVIRLVGAALAPDYQVRAAPGVERALRSMALTPAPALALCGFTQAQADASGLSAALAQATVPLEYLVRPLHVRALLDQVHARTGRPPRTDDGGADSLAGYRLLVVDDDEVSRLAIGNCLEGTGVGIACAADGPAALAHLSRERVDWVLLDMRLPGMDGPDVCRRLRTLPGGSVVPVIALTGNDSPADRTACAQAGMDAYLVKPVMYDTLIAALRRWRDRAHDPRAVPDFQAGNDWRAAADPVAHSAPAEVFDGTVLAKLGQNNASRQRKYADAFTDAMHKGLADCQTALAAGDQEGLRQLAHRLKSNARWIGARSLGEAWYALEQAASGAAWADASARAALAACAQGFAAAAPLLQNHLDTLSTE